MANRLNMLQRHLVTPNECSAEVIECSGKHGMAFEDWQVGQKLMTKRRTISETDLINYINMTGYHAENLFGDMVYLKSEAGHKKRLVPGLLTGSFADALIVGSGILDGAIALVKITDFVAKAPVYAEDTIQVFLEVTAVKASQTKPDRGVVTTKQVVKNQDGKVVLEYVVSRMIRRRQK